MVYSLCRVFVGVLLVFCLNIHSHAKKLGGIKTFLSNFNVSPSIGFSLVEQKHLINNVNLFNKDHIFYFKGEDKSIYIIQWPYDNPVEVSDDYVNVDTGALEEKTYEFKSRVRVLPISLSIYGDFLDRFRVGVKGGVCITRMTGLDITNVGEKGEFIESYPEKYKPIYSTSYSTNVSILAGYKFIRMGRFSALFDHNYGFAFCHPRGEFLTKNLGMSAMIDLGLTAEIDLMSNLRLFSRLGYTFGYNSMSGYLSDEIAYTKVEDGICFGIGASFNLGGTTYPRCSVLGCDVRTNHSHEGSYYSRR
jgi:hypothetical protein